jgi:dipeptidyl aminopeptidase/acylaminoacyl peptidase
MYHSPIGKPSLRVVLVMGLLIGLCSLLLLAACGGGNSAKGGADQEHKKSTSGGTASSDGLIAFRRYLDLELTPDGRRHSKFAIFTMYPNGSHIRQITHPPKGFTDDSPVWSPDGERVAFYRQAIDENTSRIMVLNTKTGDERQVGSVEGSDPAFSPDGKRLALKRSSGIWIVRLDGSGLHQKTNVQKRGALEFEDSGPAFSPDGKRLVFERTRVADDHTAVFVQPLDSSITGSPEDARQITPWQMNCGYGPEFSPNGNWVLFSCLPKGEGGPSNLYSTRPENPYVEVPEAADIDPYNDTGLSNDRVNGTGLYKISHAPDDWHYVDSSFSPEFHKAWGNIVVARQPGYGDEGNSDVFFVHNEIGVSGVPAVNLTKSETLDDAPDWGTHPPSLQTLQSRGCDAPPKEAPRWCLKG